MSTEVVGFRLNTKTSCSPVMKALIRMRFRSSLQTAIDHWRLWKEFEDSRHRDSAREFLGKADGMVSVLYDTDWEAYPALQHVEEVRRIFDGG